VCDELDVSLSPSPGSRSGKGSFMLFSIRLLSIWFVLVLVGFAQPAEATPFSFGPGAPVPDDGSGTLTVSDPGLIADLNVSVTGNSGTYSGLSLTLTSPMGTQVKFVFTGTALNVTSSWTFDDESADPYPGGFAPDGTYQPLNPLAAFDGESLAGTWTLSDGTDGGGGVFDAQVLTWSISGATVPEPSTALLMGLGLAGLASRRR
jgi:hypothetical protein